MMILADKIMYHRKKLGLTQEELAENLNVTRQSVSKWEGAQTIPDMDKIIQLSNVFSVSIDYLLRDELENPEYLDQDKLSPLKKINLEFSNQFILDNDKHAKVVALSVLLFILSPVVLIFLTLLVEDGVWSMSEESSSAWGLILMFLMVAVGVGMILKSSIDMSQYAFLDKDEFDIEYGVEGVVKSKQALYKPIRSTKTTMGVMLLIVSVIPLFISQLLIDSTLLEAASVPLLLCFIAFGVYLIVKVNIHNSAYKKILQEDDYSPINKKRAPIYGKIAGIYWLSVVTIYLAMSFMKDAWGRSWIIWPVTGVLFGVVSAVASIFIDKKN